eukprot:85756_1
MPIVKTGIPKHPPNERIATPMRRIHLVLVMKISIFAANCIAKPIRNEVETPRLSTMTPVSSPNAVTSAPHTPYNVPAVKSEYPKSSLRNRVKIKEKEKYEKLSRNLSR